MSSLDAFLNPVSTTEEKEIVISDRFQEKGKPVPFKIRALTQEENEAISRRCTQYKNVKGQRVEEMDTRRYSRELVCAATIEPNFADKRMCDKYGVADPTLVPGKMLLSGEYAKLVDSITKLSGFDEDVEETVKN